MPEPSTQRVDTAAPDYPGTTIAIGEKYTVAVMGAVGVGKTVFLGSYFHMKKKLGMGKHSVFENNQESWRKVKTMLDTLFVKKEPVAETSRHNDLGFSVPDLMMAVDLKSVPDGDTKNISGWADKVVSQLRRADGVICFISGEDLILHPDEISPDNTVFMKAISIFKRTWSLGRTNIPVWFIVTKGDTIPDVSEDELKHVCVALFAPWKRRSLPLARRIASASSWILGRASTLLPRSGAAVRRNGSSTTSSVAFAWENEVRRDRCRRGTRRCGSGACLGALGL